MKTITSWPVVAMLTAIAAICIYMYPWAHSGLAGDGTATPDEAIAQISIMADLGDAETQFQLAGMYYKGAGVTQNYLESLKWLHEAAEQGHVGAYYKLGEVYRIGQGLRGNIQSVPEDRAESAKWYRKAAEQGHVEAQMFLQIYAEEDEKAGVAKVW
jgi:TPR repeat protein